MRAMTPIPVRRPPLVEEDLDSLVARSAARMGYERVSWLLKPEQPAGAVIQATSLAMLQTRADYDLLGSLLNLREEALYRHTLHQFAPHLRFSPSATEEARQGEGGSEWIARPLLPQRLLPALVLGAEHVALCSLCLAEGLPYGRLRWRFAFLPVCLRHSVWLLNRCPACGRAIRALRDYITRCRRCNADYRTAQTRAAPSNPYFLVGQRVILWRLGLERDAPSPLEELPSDVRDSPLMRLPSPYFFDLLSRIGGYVLKLKGAATGAPLTWEVEPRQALGRARNYPRIYKGTQEEWAEIVSGVQYLFGAWPQRFHQFLEALDRSRADEKRTTTLSRSFGRFYSDLLYTRWRDPALTFLHQAFEDYMGDHYNGGLVAPRAFASETPRRTYAVASRRYVNLKVAQRALHCDRKLANRLIAVGLLKANIKTTKGFANKRCYLVDRESLDQLTAEWCRIQPWYPLARQYFGATYTDNRSPQEGVWLRPWRDGVMEKGGEALYDPRDFERYSADVLRLVSHEPAPPGAISLRSATRRLRLGLFAALDEIVAGNLQAIDSRKKKPLCQRLLVTVDETRRYRAEQIRHQCAEAGLLSTKEAAAALGVGTPQVLRWASKGLLKRQWWPQTGDSRRRKYFTRTGVAAFQHTYVLASEARRLLGISPSWFSYQYLARGMLRPVDQGGTRKERRLLFRRADVLALQAEQS